MFRGDRRFYGEFDDDRARHAERSLSFRRDERVIDRLRFQITTSQSLRLSST